jgi:hypothetical protein
MLTKNLLRGLIAITVFLAFNSGIAFANGGQYTLTYDANGGTGAAPAGPTAYTSDMAVAVQANNGGYTKLGYTDSETWYTNTNYNGTAYARKWTCYTTRTDWNQQGISIL